MRLKELVRMYAGTEDVIRVEFKRETIAMTADDWLGMGSCPLTNRIVASIRVINNELYVVTKY